MRHLQHAVPWTAASNSAGKVIKNADSWTVACENVGLVQSFSTGIDFVPQGHLAVSGDVPVYNNQGMKGDTGI